MRRPVNERQRAAISRLQDGYDGKLTYSKYATHAKYSRDTDLRDINGLLVRGILIREEDGGKCTAERLKETPVSKTGQAEHH